MNMKIFSIISRKLSEIARCRLRARKTKVDFDMDLFTEGTTRLKGNDSPDIREYYDCWWTANKTATIKEIGTDEINFCNWILELIYPAPNRRILDIGCGKGILLRIAKQRGLYAYGIDISKAAVEIARKNVIKSDILVEDAHNLPWRDNHFDYITCLGSLEHFANPEKSICEMARVLKPDGLACIFVPNSYFIGHIYMAFRYGIAPSEGFQNFSEKFGTRLEWQKLLEKNGLEVLKTYKYNEIWASNKVDYITKLLYNFALRPFIPLNLSYGFAYVCKNRRGN